MIINETLLLEYGADYNHYKDNDIIFHARSQPHLFSQVAGA
ncbi:hypothetical protein SAMN05421841_0652 [Chryseobacterium wanjuense]|uniref:Uncharacterized protein n=1 Tax=Chryseobacterium wanjuense TaxID=356305 RepID=A0A1I0NKX0_9FLAO|nr:hypothetical protein [Chryseobacterium wanjuense]SEW01914.1 hypothetical protein SAMN05421841_0652 [Chryseobacterium wanjuense]